MLISWPRPIPMRWVNRDVHVTIFGKRMSSKDWVKFANVLKGDFSRCGSDMAAVGATLEKWSIVSNRFAMIAAGAMLSVKRHRPLSHLVGGEVFIAPM